MESDQLPGLGHRKVLGQGVRMRGIGIARPFFRRSRGLRRRGDYEVAGVASYMPGTVSVTSRNSEFADSVRSTCAQAEPQGFIRRSDASFRRSVACNPMPHLAVHHAKKPVNRRIDSYSVRLFVAAARAGSIVRAAAAENIAPSALSRRLADLEHAFETPLLVRSPRGIALTEAGKLVLARGERIDEELQALLREVQSKGGEVRGTVRLYANMSSVIGFLPERLQRFMAAYPGVEVALHEEDTRDVLRARGAHDCVSRRQG